MSDLWQSLVGNLALVALFISIWTHIQHWAVRRSAAIRQMLFGGFMGAGAVSSMLMAVQLQPGFFFDLRTALLAVSGFFGGPRAALVSGCAALAYRVWLGGGGVWAGAFGITLASGIGVFVYFSLKGKEPKSWHVMVLAVLVVLVTFLGFTALPRPVFIEMLSRLGPPLGLLSFMATALAGLVIVDARRRAHERDLLLAALAQAPDYFYVKDTHSRFAAVNKAVADIHGFAAPAAMVGATDFDLGPADRAQELFAAEQNLMTSGTASLQFEEEFSHETGEMYWFETTKVPLHNGTGELIGLAGVTRDVTLNKQIRAELEASRNLLSYALAEMSDGVAMFDSGGYLIFCNDRYRDSFPLSGPMRQPGTHISTILRCVAESGEQLTAPRDASEEWIAKTSALLHLESEEEVHLFNGRWLHLRTRKTGDGTAMVVVSDVSTLKQAETDLLIASEQLKHLATTDGLTGLVNRRAFDEALEREVKRSLRGPTPLSLMLIDVDRFKAFNDLYGHPAGDTCLRAVSACLKTILRRPADLAARYGGEELAAILPETNEDGAYFIADEFLKALRQMHIVHEGSEKGIVSVSIGIASYGTGPSGRSSAELIQKADEALYGAKAAGRDRVNGWHASSQDTGTYPGIVSKSW